MENSLDKKEVALCAFLDIEGAFDNTPHEAMCQALVARGIHRTVINWIRSMLSSRQAETITETGAISVTTTRGCPQGGVLSPLLWSLVVDGLLHRLSDRGIMAIGYADDIVLVARGKFEGVLCDLIETALTVVSEWCDTVGLRVNPTKTKLVYFSRRRTLNLRRIPFLGEVVDWSNEVKFLGITLDSKLLWRTHMQVTLKKATNAIMACRRLAGTNWGCTPKTLLTLYKMMVIPIVTYGSVVWAGRVQLTTARNSLSKVQRLACLCITGAIRSCPTAAIEVILGLSPLHLVVERHAASAAIRLVVKRPTTLPAAMGTLPMAAAHVESLRDDMSRIYSFDKKFKIEFSNKTEWSNEASMYNLKSHVIKWYTDGSRMDTGTGAGVFGPGIRFSEPLGKFPSVFQAEVHAIGRCAQFNLDRRYRNREIAILSDSQAAIKALNSHIISSKTVWDCLTKLNELGRDNKVSLLWIPGHAGEPGNETADELARQASSLPFVGPEPFCSISMQTFKSTLQKAEMHARSDLWHASPGMRHSKLMLGDFNLKRTMVCTSLPRSALRILTGFLTGHCSLRKHLMRIGLSNESDCRFCGDLEETPLHLLLDCPALMHSRHRCLGMYLVEEPELHELDPKKILNFIKALGLDVVL